MELLIMSQSESTRLRVLQEVRDRVRTRAQAGIELGLSERQLRRLLRRVEAEGAEAIISKRRGRPPNNRLADDVRATILARCRAEYRGFGPTFLAEVLRERDDIAVSREWLRALLVENGLWKSTRRKRNIHPLRTRRPRFGELIQMDGSPHDWFEGRAPRSTLLLAIDDATSCDIAGNPGRA
jgi:transposase